MQANLCIEGYPDKNTPTILVYKDGAIKRQMVTLKELKGDRTSVADLEDVLRSLGAVKPGDVRLQNRNGADGELETKSGIRQGTTNAANDSDSDWD